MTTLLPHLELLRQQLEERSPRDKHRETFFALEALPYALQSTHQALFDFADAVRELSDKCLSKNDKPNAIVLTKPEKLSFRIDSFLESARRTQNAIVPYISKAHSVSLPISLSDVAGKLEDRKLKLPANIAQTICGYWNKHGRKLKDYRDLSTHFSLVVSEVRVFRASNGKPAIYLTLPNNPECKCGAKLTYDNPPVHAFSYLGSQLEALIVFCHAITKALVKPPTGPFWQKQTRVMFHGGALKLGTGVTIPGHPVLSDGEVRDRISKLVSSLCRCYPSKKCSPTEAKRAFLRSMELASVKDSNTSRRVDSKNSTQ